MQAESSINPGRYEGGVGPGYGLVQWTPKQDLIDACNTLGLTPYTSGDVQIQVIIKEIDGVKCEPYEKVVINLFRSVENVKLDTIISYRKGDKFYHFLDDYNK